MRILRQDMNDNAVQYPRVASFCSKRIAAQTIKTSHSPISNVQAVYLIIVDPQPQKYIRAFSVVVLTSEPGSRGHYCSIPKRSINTHRV